MANTINSNDTGLRFAEEIDLKTLSGSPVWYALDPNGYNDFGSELSLVARNPINPSRQRKKGVITDLNASGGFTSDFTQTNLTRLLQGVLFANIREKPTNQPMNGAAIPVSGITGSTYTLASGTLGSSFAAGDLLFAQGFAQTNNNGLKQVTSSTATTIVSTTALTAEPAPPTTAEVQKVGIQFAAGVATMDVSGSFPRLLRASGTLDFTTLGLVPGEWVFIGGDAAITRFANAANNGMARVRSVAATFIELDKLSTTPAADAAAAQTIRLFFGNVIKNESLPSLIVRKTYQLERTVGLDANGTMSEYLVGAVANEFTLNCPSADKITADLSFIAMDNEQRPGTLGVKTGTRPTLVDAPAFNTSSDFSRIKMHLVTAGNANPAPLFAYLTEMSVAINNNVSPTKALGTLGAIDTTTGTFEVSGNVTAYFNSMEAVAAVRNNADVTLDFAIVKANAGWVFDIPLIALGDGRLNVEQDQKVTLPLSINAAVGDAGHTMLVNEFPYLPSIADL